MTSRELLYIKTIADEKNITQAAKKLFVTQPSLSHCISGIEAQLGEKLFRRTSSGLVLTYAGEQYYRMACEVLRIYTDFETRIKDMGSLTHGRITFGITNYLSINLIPKVMPAFHSRYPGIELNMVEKTSAEMEDGLMKGELDFAIIQSGLGGEISANPDICADVLSRDPFLLVAPWDTPYAAEDHPASGTLPVLDPKVLKNEPFLLGLPTQRIRQVSDCILRKAGIEPHVVLTSRNFETLRRLCAHGMGYTFLPRQYAGILGGNEHRCRYFALPEKYGAYWDLTISYVKDSYLSNAAQTFLDMLRDIVAREEAGIL
ncbi:MAG: LysR family transcriptional regulator [Clostridia bacterium]|nr:LysR family transcriptional regulator [Clostridia bacterium]